MCIPFEERLAFIVEQYGHFDKLSLIEASLRIQKRLGGLETKNTINAIESGDIKEAFSILLKYYDKWYNKFSKATNNKEKNEAYIKSIKYLDLPDVDPIKNSKLLSSL
jgi:tRNA 2-selenouridine synthase